MNSLPRWLISITDIPLPRQSSISSPARESTSAGSMAGPALKLKILDISAPSGTEVRSRLRRRRRRCRRRHFTVAIAVAVDVALLDALQARELLALGERDQGDALGGAAHHA